jgi:hypothetical protein
VFGLLPYSIYITKIVVVALQYLLLVIFSSSILSFSALLHHKLLLLLVLGLLVSDYDKTSDLIIVLSNRELQVGQVSHH